MEGFLTWSDERLVQSPPGSKQTPFHFPQKVLYCSILVFALGSLLCGAAQVPYYLIADQDYIAYRVTPYLYVF
jgi:hypothetical protein